MGELNSPVDILNASGVPFLVGGAYAFNRYTGINRHTRDLDIFIRRSDYEPISAALRQETHSPSPEHDICLGTLLSREQYLKDIEQEGLQDGRVAPLGNMTQEDTATWTQAIQEHQKPH